MWLKFWITVNIFTKCPTSKKIKVEHLINLLCQVSLAKKNHFVKIIYKLNICWKPESFWSKTGLFVVSPHNFRISGGLDSELSGLVPGRGVGEKGGDSTSIPPIAGRFRSRSGGCNQSRQITHHRWPLVGLDLGSPHPMMPLAKVSAGEQLSKSTACP